MRRGYPVKIRIACALLVIGAILVSGANKESDPDEARLALPIAKVDGKPVTIRYMESITEKQNPAMIKELSNKEKLDEFIGKVVEMELLAAEAEKRGFKEHAEVASSVKNQLATLMHKKIADSVEEYEPTEEEMKKHYEDDADTYHKPEMVRARHIVMKDKEKAEKLLKELRESKASQHDFRRAAQDHSEDESTKTRGGDLAFFTKPEERREGDPEIDPILVETAFKLKKNGDIHNKLVETKQGYHILMRTGHRDRMDMSFDQARKRISTLLKRENQKEQIDTKIEDVKNRFKVEVFDENLKHVVIDLSAGPGEKPKKGMLMNKYTDKPLPVKRGPARP